MKRTILALAIMALFAACSSAPIPGPEPTPICREGQALPSCYGKNGGH